MLTEVKGLIVREVGLSDNDKLLTVITEEQGKITAVANGSRTLKSRYLAAAQLFCYGSYVLYQKGDRYWVRESSLIESFFDLRKDLSRMSLAAYICDVADDVVEENAPDPELLRLLLNTLYALAQGKYPTEHIRAVFEMRAAAILGFMPLLGGCASCGKTEGEFFLDVMNGELHCRSCFDARSEISVSEEEADDIRTARIICPLSSAAYTALCYATAGPIERLFSFRLTQEEDERLFFSAAEKYLLHHLERGFKSLDFYKQTLS